MQYRVLDRRTLRYKDGGFVPDWSIDDDYINNNNSTIDIVSAAVNANVGDLIFLIKTSGARAKGIITSVDNDALQITFKSDKELFNDNILNPLAAAFESDTEIDVAGVFGIDVIAEMIMIYWGKNIDPCRRLPITVTTSGNTEIYWTWQETQINFVDWLVSLFKDYSIVITFDIDFDTATTDLENRKAKYIVNISVVNNDNDMIKDNVSTQTIKYTKEGLPEKTCCWVVDKETKEPITLMSGRNKFDATFGWGDSVLDGRTGKAEDVPGDGQESNVSSYISIQGGQDYVLSWANGDMVERKIMFYDSQGMVITFEHNSANTTYLEYNGVSGYFTFTSPSGATKLRICYPKRGTNIQFEQGTTPTAYEVYSYKAIYYLCVRSDGSYEITTNKDDPDRILPVRTVFAEYDMSNGNDNTAVEQVAANELKLSSLNHAIEIEIPSDTKMFDFELAKYGDRYKIITKNGTITSIYSGKRESSASNMVTLLFGIGRLNFTDLIKDTLRSRKYTKIYSRQE